jgi:hypothetical protein
MDREGREHADAHPAHRVTRKVEGDEIPYQPWAAIRKKENFDNWLDRDPEIACYLPGVPRITYMPYPFQIVQSPGRLTQLYEYVRATRTIYTNGTAHPKGPIDWWLGDSRGHWEGDTLVVDVVHFNDQTWFDHAGNFHSDALHVVERWSFLDANTIDYRATLEDPKTFSRPWTIEMPLYRLIDDNAQILEHKCVPFADKLLYSDLMHLEPQQKNAPDPKGFRERTQ